ncbi:hypothetical protein DM02DRAFT_703283 [Periconia macrospinosa]|uniref:SAP domain-containing protein n=1 Tax=Periconia macrospinosa TaxID=97972 RepID=A0A2V1EA14_9PLEO|nr:hypothetical protein DM02DRAFT_703283 [Periconia macrospinosa]
MAGDLTFVDADDVGHDEVGYESEYSGISMDGEEDEDYTPHDDANDDDFSIQGYEDYRVATPEHDEEDGNNEGRTTKRSRPAFHQRSMRHAERAGRRVRFTHDENSILLLGDAGDEEAKPRGPTSRVPGTFGRRNREKGSTLPAYHKKVTADLDSDDELMMDMRDKGYSDRQIADRLSRDGRVRFDMKSIATRVYRIRTAQAEHVDYLLKEGYVEWKAEDDQLLMRAYDLADIEIRYEMERLRAWRFRKVSEYMRRLNKSTVFSAEACADRYIKLVDGTAVIPSEIDDDPEARKRAQLEFVSKREAEREVEIRAKEKAEDEARRIKDEARSRQAKKAAEVAAKREQKETEKTNRAILRATKAQVRQQRASENTRRKQERKAQLAAAKRRRERDARTREHMKSIYGNDVIKAIGSSAPDPRQTLTTAELRVLCTQRGLESEGTKARLLQRIQEQDKRYDALELKERCQERKIPFGNNKSVMKYQLALFESRSFAYNDLGSDDDEDGEAGHHAPDLNAKPDSSAILDFGGEEDSEVSNELSDIE